MQNMRTITSRQLCLRLMHYIAPYWDALMLALICMIAMAATVPILAALVLPMLDGVIARRNLELIQLILLGIIGLFTVRGVAGQIGAYAINWVGNKLVMDLRTEMFDKLLTLPAHYYAGRPSTSIVSRITLGTNQLARAFVDLVTVMVKETFTVLGLLGWMLYLNWELSMLALLMTSVILFIIRKITGRLLGMEREAGQTMEGLSRVLNNSVENRLVVNLHGGEKYERQRVREQTEEISRFVMKRMVIASLYVPLMQIASAVMLVVIGYFAAQQASADEITAGGFASLIAAILMLIAPVKRIAGIKEALDGGLIAAESVFSLLDQEAETDTGTLTLEHARGELRFEHVCFPYDRLKHPEAHSKIDASDAKLCSVFRDFTLTIQPGERVALVGFRGSAAALASLVPRFLNPASGRILFDGHDLNSLKLTSLRSNIAFVSPDTAIFNDTIAANIAYGVMNRATEGMITAAARAAHASEFIREMPEGLQTQVGEHGVKLTGGQRMRVAIARALLKNSPVLLLDEAFGTIDAESMHHVQAALDAVMEGRTTLVIANRLATVEKADRVVLVDKERIVETGSHLEMLAKGGAYARFARTLFEQDGSQENS